MRRAAAGAHTHAELLRLPSISRRLEGARVVVVVGASVVVVLGACVVVVVVAVIGVFVVVVVAGAFGFSFCSVSATAFVCSACSLLNCPSCSCFLLRLRCDSSVSVTVPVVVSVCSFALSPFFAFCKEGVASSESVDSLGPSGFSNFGTEPFPDLPVGSSLSATHTDGQQHRASTKRAHSRRHVVIVSVVVQWCGAVLHSEGHGEQQGDERCGRHTQRAHHMRGQQPRMHRTPHTTHNTHSNPRQQAHTHSPAATPTHRWKREKQTGAAHKGPPHAHIRRERSVVPAPLTEGTHTQEEV
ncbi:hypothetical protein TCSYLVIO_008351, partial [Trypanosoma cruzi]